MDRARNAADFGARACTLFGEIVDHMPIVMLARAVWSALGRVGPRAQPTVRLGRLASSGMSGR